ncbi:MAG: ferredoxin [Candidatus Woesearchaeota archaeon]
MTKKKYKIEYERESCIGAGACTVVSPYLFQMDNENKATMIKEGAKKTPKKEEIILELDQDELEELKQAAEACPVNVIHITDLETGERLI